MSLVQYGKTEPTDLAVKAYASISDGWWGSSGTNTNDTYSKSFTSSDWAVNSIINNIDTQTSGTLANPGYQNKIILIEWSGTYLGSSTYGESTNFYQYSVWHAAKEYQESNFKVILRVQAPFSSATTTTSRCNVAEYVIEEQSAGADEGYNWVVSSGKTGYYTMYGNGNNATTYRSYYYTTSPANLYPKKITFLSPNVFPVVSI